MATNGDILKNKMLAALEKSLGIVSSAAKYAGIARNTHYEWMQSDAEYKAKVDELSNIALDFAESKLFESIKNGSDTATIFLLKTKGKHRGYVERQENRQVDGEGNDVQPILIGYGKPA